DVTGRKRAERALRDSESELRRAQQIANLGRWSWHIPSHRVEWSEQMYQIFGLDAETFTGDLQTIVESAIHPDDRPLVERVNREVATTGRTTPLQYRVVRPDGSLRTVWAEAAELERDADGRPLRLTGIVQDITDRVQSDVERARLVAAIEQAGEAIVITDRAGAIQYVNPAFEQVTGYGRAEVIGRNPRLLQSGRQTAAFYREMWETIASGATWRGRLVNRRRDGTVFTEDAVISPVVDEVGEIASYVAVKRDVSAELELETQLRQAQKLEAIGSLAGGIAHDFNNMLGVILGNAELVMTQTLPEPARERIVEIVRAGERSAQLTRQLLGFARKQSVTPCALDLNETVEGLLKMLRRLIGENVELDWRPASSLWEAWMDPSQVDQILTNLCVNARDAIAGAGRIAISTGNRSVAADDPEAPGALPPGDYVWLAVRDSGCGMDADVLAHIFEPFYTTKETGQGTGLGLATVYGIVQQNRGQITVDSRPGGGAIFTVLLPRHHGAPVADEPAAAKSTQRGHGECVLVVEDDPALLRVLVQTLARHGYEALAADGPAAALAVAAAHPRPIHLLLSDVVMPGMTGYQLAEQFAALRPAARRLFMSGYASGTQLPAGLATAHLEFIQKPFAASDLAARLRELLAAE
ncbi:MAG: PAS domain S-box protein, partial [Thermoanaerobaculia bacterium]|nr:PAS domain S-box protein [Thermoanaerobaculia bacterium]